MSEGEHFRPRRGWQEPDAEPEVSTALDDTPAPAGRRARRGAAPEPADGQPARAASVAGLGDEPPDPVVNPYARPGSEAADTPIPAPVLPRSAGEFAESPGPAPRRSALSSATPVTADEEVAPPQRHWLEAHRSTLLKWAAAGVAAALVLALIAFLVVRATRQGTPEDQATPTPSATSTAPAADVDDLIGPDDLVAVASSSWTTTATSQTLGGHTGRVACFQTAPDEPNPTVTLQRTLATTDETAALHRIDVFASADVAKEVVASRIAVLSSCSEVPSYIVSSQQVSGLAEEAFQITVEFQNEQPQFHTVLITRSGAAVQMLDVTKFTSAVDPATPAEALTRSQTALSAAQDAAAPADVTVTQATIPQIDPAGWLTVSDLPRLRAGSGRWTMTGPGDLTATGTGCENVTLATEPGPRTRSQATYLMTQDDEAPSTFGIDQMQFSFEKNDTAQEFADKLVRNLAGCADRINTATVKRLDDVKTTIGDVSGTTRIFEVKQATSATASVSYQLLVTRVGDLVSYSLVSVSDDYRLSAAQLKDLAARVAVRATQAA